MSLLIGQKAPDFTLPSTSGSDFTLSKDLLFKPCLIYFYFKNFTVGCTNEACGYRDTFDIFQQFEVPVIGISRDDMTSHLKFKKMLDLPFHLLSDEDIKVSKLYETIPAGMSFFTKRTTYLLDRNHNVAAVYENIFSSAQHVKKMVEKVNKWKSPLTPEGGTKDSNLRKTF